MSTFTTNDGVTLTYHDNEKPGIPLVMLHGWSQTQAMFKYQLDGLNRHVITVDQRGHGLSEKPHHGYRIARFGQDFRDFLEHLGYEKVDILGWSMGVSVLWSYMDQNGTGRVRKFVSVDQPAACAAVPWMTKEEQLESGAIFDVQGVLDLGAQILAPGGEVATEAFERSMFSGEPAPDVWKFVVEEIKSVPAYGSVPLLFDHCAQDWRDVLPRLDVPTLVIGCDGSHVNPDSQRYITSKMPHAQIHVFPSDIANSHFPFLENPRAFNEVVDDFLGS